MRTTDRQTVRYLGATHICRGLEAEMKECGDPVGQLPSPPRSAQPSGTTQPQPQVFVDTLPSTIQEQNPTGEISYAVEVMNRDGRSAGFSNRVSVPAVPTLPPPADFRAELTANGVALAWTSAGETSYQRGVQHRYRIYRRDETSGKEMIAGELLFGEPGPRQVLDSSLEWEKTYYYRATAVSAARVGVLHPCGDQGVPAIADCSTVVQVEGDDSPEVKVVAHDVFPPAVSTGLQAVYSGEGQKPFVDLIWAPVTDADLAGYNVYRREADGPAARVSSELVKSPAYRDIAVTSGKTYFYSVSGVDVRGNESARSEEANESVP